MELTQISGDIQITKKVTIIDNITLNDSDVFGNGETSMPCFQLQLNSKNNDLLSCIDITVNDAIILKNSLNAFLDKIKCGIQTQYINNEFKQNINN